MNIQQTATLVFLMGLISANLFAQNESDWSGKWGDSKIFETELGKMWVIEYLPRSNEGKSEIISNVQTTLFTYSAAILALKYDSLSIDTIYKTFGEVTYFGIFTEMENKYQLFYLSLDNVKLFSDGKKSYEELIGSIVTESIPRPTKENNIKNLSNQNSAGRSERSNFFKMNHFKRYHPIEIGFLILLIQNKSFSTNYGFELSNTFNYNPGALFTFKYRISGGWFEGSEPGIKSRMLIPSVNFGPQLNLFRDARFSLRPCITAGWTPINVQSTFSFFDPNFGITFSREENYWYLNNWSVIYGGELDIWISEKFAVYAGYEIVRTLAEIYPEVYNGSDEGKKLNYTQIKIGLIF